MVVACRGRPWHGWVGISQPHLPVVVFMLLATEWTTGRAWIPGCTCMNYYEADVRLTSCWSQHQTSEIKMTLYILCVSVFWVACSESKLSIPSGFCGNWLRRWKRFWISPDRQSQSCSQHFAMLQLGMDGCYGNLLCCVHHLDTVQLQVMSVPRPTGRHELTFSLITILRCLMTPLKKVFVKNATSLSMAACWKKWLSAQLTIALIWVISARTECKFNQIHFPTQDGSR